MRHRQQSATPGGTRLRALREARGKTQFELELDASLGSGYLQRLELGKVYQPERETLERILAALDANFAERREILGLFGYTVETSLPDAAEIRRAVAVFRAEVEQAAVPAYLLDCAHRLLAWNDAIPELFRLDETLLRGGDAASLSIARLIFDPSISPFMLNGQDFFAAQMRILHYERQRAGSEAWFTAFAGEMRRYPLFDTCWRAYESGQLPLPVRPLVPLKLESGGRRLQFRLMSAPFVQDYRFRVMYYLPADADTIQQCQRWQNSMQAAI